MHNQGVRSLLLLLSTLLYIGVLGAHPIVYPTPLTSDLSVSLVADDTDLDDDIVSSTCVHCQTFDDGLQNFDRAAAPRLAFQPECARFVLVSSAAGQRLDDGGLFRPPRQLLL